MIVSIKRWGGLILIGAAALLGACGQQPATSAPTTVATEAPPTPVVSPTAVLTATPLVRATLPPSWTPVISLTPSITPSASITLTPSKTNTPTDTPTITPSLTFTPTPTPRLTDIALAQQPLLPACVNFGADPERTSSTFIFGDAPIVYWTPVDAAAVYQIRLVDENQTTLKTDTTTDTQYTFDVKYFEDGGIYGWDVIPLDQDGVQMCPSRGGLLRPST